MLRIVVMGVSGSGKSTLGAAIATRLNGTFIEGDDLHPASNRAHMAAGHPLTDDMRWPWLDKCADALADSTDHVTILACSALKRVYRDRLRQRVPDLIVVYPTASADLIATRLAARQGHFMPTGLLGSQLATLEPPGRDERQIVVSSAAPVLTMLDEVIAGLGPDQVRP